ncbi:hypothetical protein [Niabella aquatica]
MAYFHTDTEIEAEMQEAGFTIPYALGLTGLSGIAPDLEPDTEDKMKKSDCSLPPN